MNGTESTSPSLSSLRRTYLPEVGLLLLCLFLFFWRLGSVPLFDLDEALYVTCSKQMALSGDMTTPRLNSRPQTRPETTLVPFFEKPILVYWVCAASLRTFGMSETAARLPVALAALCTTGLVFFAGKRWFGRRAGLLAAAVYATAPMTLVDARQMTTDGLLVLWFSIALFSFYELQLRWRQASHDRSTGFGANLFLLLLFWGTCALAVLTKGAVGLLLPAMVICVFLTFRGLSVLAAWGGGAGLNISMSGSLHPWRSGIGRLRLLRPILGLLLVLLIVAPWHLAIARTKEHDAEGRTWVQEYVVRQHIGRFKGLDTVHNAPLPTYFVYFLFGFFPWACFAPAAFRRVRSAPADSTLGGTKRLGLTLETASDAETSETTPSPASPQAAAPHDFLLIWFWTIFLFFTIGAAKLPTYIVPCYPAAALLIGCWLDRTICEGRRGLRAGAFAALVTTTILVVGTIAAPHLVPKDRPIPAEMISALLQITLLLFVGCGAAWWTLRWRGDNAKGRMIGVGLLVATMAGLIAVGTSEGYTVAAKYVLGPYQHIASAAAPDAANGVPVVFYHIIPRRPSMLYYGGYSPIERKEEPLLPTVRTLLQTAATVDIVTAGDIYNGKLRQELDVSPDMTAVLLRQEGTERGGWVLLRLAHVLHKDVLTPPLRTVSPTP